MDFRQPAHKTCLEQQIPLGTIRNWLIREFLNRPREATEVYVTGTFDDWGKTVQLEKKGTGFEKEVHLPAIEGKIQYKVRGSSLD
jgi:hypothetical protein